MIVGLQVLFIGLKLLGLINWSWFWVMSPLITSVLFWVLVVAIAVAKAIADD